MREGLKQVERKRRGGIFSSRLLCTTSLSALALLGLPSAAHAQDANRNWDANGTALGHGGSGTWNTTGANWSPNADGTSGPYVPPWDNTLLDNAIFGGTAGTVLLGVPITAHDLTFTVNGYTLTGNTLTLAGVAPTITVTSGTSTIASTISASAGLTKGGVGTLNLSGNNSIAGVSVDAGTLNLTGNNSFTGLTVNAGVLGLYGTNSVTGPINVNAGTLLVSSNAALGAAGNVINLANGAVLNSSGSLAGRSVNLTGGLGTAYFQAGSAHFTGVGGLTLVAVGSTGSITMSDNTNDFTGNVNLVVNNAAAAGFTSIADAGQASAFGAGDTINFQANTGVSGLYYSGTGSSSNRTWQITSGGGTPTALIRNNGSGTLTLTGNMSATGAVQVALAANTADLQALGVLSGSASSEFRFIASGAGTVTLGNANTFTGSAVIEGGVVRVGTLADSGATSSLGAGTGIRIDNGILSYTGVGATSNRPLHVLGSVGAIRNDGSGAMTFSGATSLGGNLTLGGSYTGADNTLSGVISGAGNLISSGPATWVLTGANTRSGTITMNNGTLRAGNASAFGTTSSLTINGGTLDLNGFDMTTVSLAGLGGTVALGGGNLTLTAPSGSASFAGSITGAGGSLTKLGAGTLTLTGQSSYTGATTIGGGGTLALNFTGSGAPASNIIGASSPLVMSGGILSVTGDADGSSQTFGGLAVTSGNNRINATAGAGPLTIDFGAITRSGGLIDFTVPTSATLLTSNADGALGGWATITSGTTTKTTDYAQVVGGAIVPFAAYVNKDDASTWLNGEILSDEGGAANTQFTGAVNGSRQVGGLKYTASADSTVNIGLGQTLGVDGTIIVSSSVNNANQTIAGGSITGGVGGSTFGVLNNSIGTGAFTISSTVVDNGGATGFAKSGSGVVALTGPNTYTGGTTVSQGTLSVNTIGNGGAASAIGASSSASSNLVIEGATLRYTGAGDTSDRGFTLVTSGSITGGTIQVTEASADLAFGGLVTSPDGAGLTKTGAGTLTLSNAANDYTGVTAINGGTLSVATLANGGVASGIGASSSASTNLVLQGNGELEYTGGTIVIDRGFNLAGPGAIDVADGGTTLTMGGTVTGGAGATLSKNGAGTLVLSGNNSFAAGGYVNAGTLRAGSTQAFGSGGWTVASSATLDLNGFSNTIAALVGSGTVNLGAATLTINGGGGSFDGVISGTGGLTKTGVSSPQTITGCNNTYTGVTAIHGLLAVDCLANGGQASGIGASSSAPGFLGIGNGTLIYTGGDVTTDRGFNVAAQAGINVSNAGTTLHFSGITQGNGTLLKGGPGTLLLSGTSTRTGDTRILAGILRAGTTNAFSTAGMVIDNASGALLDLAGFNQTVGWLSGGGALGGNIDLGSARLTLNVGGAGTAFYSGAIGGTGGLTKSGSYNQQLLGCSSSYDGSTIISGGTLAVACLANGGAASSIGDSGLAAGNLVLNGGTLQYIGGATSTDRLFTLGAGGGTLNASGTGAVAFTNTGAIVLSGADSARTLTLRGSNTGDNSLAAEITDNGAGATSLTKNDAGTWILNNSGSTYTGVTSILGGVLGVDKLADGGTASSLGSSLGLASNLVIGSGSTLRYTGTGDSTNRLFTLATGVTLIESSGTGAIAFTNTGSMAFQGVGTRTFALGGSNTGANVMGVTVIDGTGGATTLAKNDAGTWSLTGTNTYTGPTNINAGTLNIGNGGATGSIASATVNNFGTLGFNRSNTLTYAGTIVGTGAVNQLGSGATVLTGANTYTGGTTISAGTLQLGNGGATGSIVGNVANNGMLTFNRNNNYTFGGTISGTGAINQIGAGATILTGTNTYSGGTTINAGTLQVSSDTNLGAASGGLTFNGGTLRTTASMTSARAVTLTGAGAFLTDSGTTLTLSGPISGAGALTKTGSGILRLTAANSYTGGTTVQAGVLALGDGTTAGSIAGDILNNGQVAFNSPGTQTYAGTITGTGSVVKNGSGTMVLTGDNAYAGATDVFSGALIINGDQSGATGNTLVSGTGTLGGTGVIGGNVNVTALGRLSPGNPGGAPGTLAINGNLSLSATTNLDFNFGEAGVPGGPLNDLITIGGNLTLDGTLNITQSPAGAFGPGVYRMFNYGGALTNNGLNVASPEYFVQTSVANQINLVNSAGLTLSFWDGDAGPHSDGAVNGGSGVWRAAGDQNWTDDSGLFAAPFANASFAIFQGAAGTVNVDTANGAVEAVGMQFGADGYIIQGGDLTLVDDPAQAGLQSVIRVGDGAAASADYTATIASDLTGAAQLVKTDAGTLVLSGANTYTGGTAINGGTVRISADANLGDAAGGLSIDGGTLNTTATFGSGRAVGLTGAGTFLTNATTFLTLNGVVSGAGALTKDGAGDLVLTNANTYTGGTTINNGTLRIGNGGTTGSIVGDVVSTGGTLRFNRSDSVMFAGVYSGNGNLLKDGAGTLVLTGDNTSIGNTRIGAGTLQIGSGGTTGSISNASDLFITGPTSALVFNRSDTWTYDGNINIIGAASMTQAGIGTTILTGSKSGSGPINVAAGTLLMNGNASASSGLTTVASGATLGGTGIIGGSVSVLDGGTLAPGSNGVGTLTINGNLGLAGAAQLAFEFGQSDIVGGALNDLVDVDGDLTLDGTIDVNVSPGGSFGPGLYRLISYGGALNDQGLATGTMPPGAVVAVQTSVAGQVNLVNAAGGAFNFWDGANAANESNNIVDGGGGTWQSGSGNNDWTTTSGQVSGPYTDGGFAIFAAVGGQVDIDNSLGAVTASGLQFASDGYTVTGQDLTLVGPQSTIRVGDGTAVGASFTATMDAAVIGNTQLVKADLGTLVLAGTNSYSGGTRIDAGTLRISSDANLGDAAGNLSFGGGTLNTTADITSSRAVDLIGTGTFLTDGGAALTLNGGITGAGGFIKSGAGDLILAGANSFTGGVDVAAGGLFVNGDHSAATGLVSVASGATLGGSGVIGGDVVLADGAVLSAGVAGASTLTINGDLSLEAGSRLDFQFGQANVAGGAFNDLVNVGGDLVLDGTINVSTTTGGAFGPGVYRVFNYGGTLTDNGLTLGSLPGGDVAVQTSIGGQVNLVNSAGLTLNFWDGNAGPKNNNLIDGGDGVWRVGGGGTNWTEASGAVNADYAQDSFVVFSAEPGTVTVDNSGGVVLTSGMQFASDGYVIAGDSLTLTGAQTTIQVGDGSTAGRDYTATIDAVLTGGAVLVKTDIGTLNLTGINTYTGGTAINGGVVRIGDNANLGDVAGGLSFSGGTLNTFADITSGRTISLAGSGAFLTDAGTTLTLTGALSGPGRLIKDGAGSLVLDGTGGQTGGFSVDAGVLLVNGDYSMATGLGRVAGAATLGGVGVIGGDVVIANGGILSPGAGAPGTLTINGDLSLSAESRLAFELGAANIPGGGLNDLVNVGGDLVLDGVLDVTVPALGAFDVGVYRLFNYAGALTDNGLTLGSLPGEGEPSVQTSILGQVNLVNSAGLTLRYWDGAAGPKNDGLINGGDGQWQSSDGNDHWTDADGALNAPFTDAAFAVFGGAAGTVTIDNSLGQVTAGGMQFATDGYVVTGDNLLLTEAQSVIRVGDGSTDAAAGFTATIDAVLEGEGQLVKTDAGLLILGGANTYAGGTLITGGTVQISSDANLGATDGAVTLDGGALATTADLISARDIVLAGAGGISTASDTTFTFDGRFSGSGALTKTGGGALVVTGDSSGFTGVTRVAEGVLTLQGALGGGVGVAGGARLEGVGRMVGLSNAGVVAPGRDGGFGTLTVAGDYLGAGGVLEIDAELGGDASPTDRLNIGGNATGATEVVVTNVGGLGGQTAQGIKIIDVAGVSSATFSLKGDYLFQGEQAVIAGAYGYRLYKGGVSSPADGDWYLRSSVLNPVDPVDPTEPEGPLYQPGVPLYEIYGANLQAINGLPTFQQRVGGRAWAAGASPERGGVWGRVEGALARERAEVSTSRVDHDLNSWKVQMGVDKVLADASGGRLIAGLTAHYGEAYSEVRSVFGGGVLDTDGYGLGATLSWQGLEGLYIDGQAQFSWYQSDVESSVLGDLAANHNGWGEAASVEVGKRLRLGENSSITPQAQVVYSGARFDDFSDPAGADVSTDQGRSLRTRVGVSIDRDETWEGGSGHVYAIANVSYEWMDPARVDVSGALIEHANERLRGELGIGFSATWRDGVTFYGETSVAGGVEDLGDSRSVKANGGIRIAF